LCYNVWHLGFLPGHSDGGGGVEGQRKRQLSMTGGVGWGNWGSNIKCGILSKKHWYEKRGGKEKTPIAQRGRASGKAVNAGREGEGWKN